MKTAADASATDLSNLGMLPSEIHGLFLLPFCFPFPFKQSVEVLFKSGPFFVIRVHVYNAGEKFMGLTLKFLEGKWGSK